MAAEPRPDRLDVVVTTAPGRIGLLRDSLYSVAALTHPSVSAIVVVPEGDDPHAEEVRGLCAHLSGLVESRIVTVAGAGARPRARNAGLEAATGEYVCFLDDGEVLYPHYAGVLLARLRELPVLTAVYGGSVRSTGRVTAHGFVVERKAAAAHEPYARARMLLGVPTGSGPPVYRRADLLAAGLRFDEGLELLEEWELLRRLSRWHEIASVPEELSERRAGGDAADPAFDRVRDAIRASSAALPVRLTEDELQRLLAEGAADRARAATLGRELDEVRRELDALRASPALRVSAGLRRAGLDRPLRAAWRLRRRLRER